MVLTGDCRSRRQRRLAHYLHRRHLG
jgi:hypothetical protein